MLSKESILSVDLEGVNLGRTGEICLVQVACLDGRVYLFDICALREAAFQGNHNLKSILEDDKIMKIMYDCRSDADALKHQYNVTAASIFDLQVLYVLVKCPRVKYLPGLKQVLSDTLTGADKHRIESIKSTGLNMFALEKGGSYDAWKQRPLHRDLLSYAAEDVKQLFVIHDRYKAAEDSDLMRRVWKKSKLRMKNAIRRKEEWPRGYKSPWAKRDF